MMLPITASLVIMVLSVLLIVKPMISDDKRMLKIILGTIFVLCFVPILLCLLYLMWVELQQQP